MSTDTGHNSTQNDATWTGNDEEMVDLYVSGAEKYHCISVV